MMVTDVWNTIQEHCDKKSQKSYLTFLRKTTFKEFGETSEMVFRSLLKAGRFIGENNIQEWLPNIMPTGKPFEMLQVVYKMSEVQLATLKECKGVITAKACSTLARLTIKEKVQFEVDKGRQVVKVDAILASRKYQLEKVWVSEYYCYLTKTGMMDECDNKGDKTETSVGVSIISDKRYEHNV